MLKRSRVPVWATFTSTPSRDEMGPLDSFEAGKTYQITRGSLNRWISIGRAREATPEEIPATGAQLIESLKEALDHVEGKPSAVVEHVVIRSDDAGPPTIQPAVIPDNWRTLPLADLRALACKFSPTPVVQKKLCIEVIEAELAKRG